CVQTEDNSDPQDRSQRFRLGMNPLATISSRTSSGTAHFEVRASVPRRTKRNSSVGASHRWRGNQRTAQNTTPAAIIANSVHATRVMSNVTGSIALVYRIGTRETQGDLRLIVG